MPAVIRTLEGNMRELLSMAALVLATTVATAQPATAQSANAATITEDFICGGFVPTPTGGIGTVIFSTEGTHSVVTSSGVANLVCHFTIPASDVPATATRASGFACGTFLGGTNDSKMVASPGGYATLTCRVRPN
jgi:hypothetical protein